MTQTTDHVLMVRPVNFAFNEETAVNNAFQKHLKGSVGQKAIEEFDAYADLLRRNGINVEVLQDTAEPSTPDSIFPNNCFSTHIDKNGKHTLVLYPMFARNRQLEREKLMSRISQTGYDEVIDLRCHEVNGMALEGTGSLVLDRIRQIAYTCLSPRTCEPLLQKWSSLMGYDIVDFESEDEQGTPIYHTNVMMHVGTRFAVVCLDSIKKEEQRSRLISVLEDSGKEIVDISMAQINHFAGNMLELHNGRGEKLLIMSQTARHSLRAEQIALLEQDMCILAPDIHTIETVGGGSARCMIAELF